MRMEDFEDISYLGRWRLSSFKEEYGLENLVSEDTEVYWQSDGEFPHYVEIQFSKVVKIKAIALFCASFSDSSYAPKDISIEAGFGPCDMLPVKRLCFDNIDKIHKEWYYIMLDDLGSEKNEMLECKTLRFNIDMNFYHGKDSHVRGLKILAPRLYDKRGINAFNPI